jgi:hypothetical protein
MDNEIRVQPHAFHTLISLEDFKAILGLDDREDTLVRYCLTAPPIPLSGTASGGCF